MLAANGVFVTFLPANSRLTRAAFRLLTGRGEKDFRGGRQRVLPMPRRYFELERVSLWPPRPAVPGYTGYRLRPKPKVDDHSTA